MRTKDFPQKRHAGLREENSKKAERKRKGLKRLAQIGGDARAEEVGQRGKEEVKRMSEF